VSLDIKLNQRNKKILK